MCQPRHDRFGCVKDTLSWNVRRCSWGSKWLLITGDSGHLRNIYRSKSIQKDKNASSQFWCFRTTQTMHWTKQREQLIKLNLKIYSESNWIKKAKIGWNFEKQAGHKRKDNTRNQQETKDKTHQRPEVWLKTILVLLEWRFSHQQEHWVRSKPQFKCQYLGELLKRLAYLTERFAQQIKAFQQEKPSYRRIQQPLSDFRKPEDSEKACKHFSKCILHSSISETKIDILVPLKGKGERLLM